MPTINLNDVVTIVNNQKADASTETKQFNFALAYATISYYMKNGSSVGLSDMMVLYGYGKASVVAEEPSQPSSMARLTASGAKQNAWYTSYTDSKTAAGGEGASTEDIQAAAMAKYIEKALTASESIESRDVEISAIYDCESLDKRTEIRAILGTKAEFVARVQELVAANTATATARIETARTAAAVVVASAAPTTGAGIGTGVAVTRDVVVATNDVSEEETAKLAADEAGVKSNLEKLTMA